MASLEKRLSARSRSLAPPLCGYGLQRPGVEDDDEARSKPPAQIVAAATCSQSARKGKKRPSAAAWLSWVKVMSSRAAEPVAAHQ